jgi:hypothetical protein
MKHDEYVEVLKSTISKLVIKSATEIVFKKVAFLAWGPLGPLTSYLIEKLVGIIINETELAIFLKYTDFRISKQGKIFSEAAIKNSEAQKNGSEDEKKKAEEELINSFRAFVKLTN